MRFSSKSRAACFCCFFSDLLIWLNLYDDQIACQCWCRQSANTWHTKLKSGASNLHGAGASNLQDNTCERPLARRLFFISSANSKLFIIFLQSHNSLEIPVNRLSTKCEVTIFLKLLITPYSFGVVWFLTCLL